MYWLEIIIKYFIPICGAFVSICALFITWSELKDSRRAEIVVSFAPPSPDLETSTIRKLRLVVENKGRGFAKNVTVMSLTPHLTFGYNTGKDHHVFKFIGNGSVDYINCFDPYGDILSQEYDISISWRGFLCHKKRCTQKIFWAMYADKYTPLSDIKEYSISPDELLKS